MQNQPTQTTEHGHFDLGDGTLYYEVAGGGETLVLSHAAFLDSRMFDALMPTLTEKFRVVRYDMRGYGQSSRVSGPVCRRDDLSRLLDHLGITRAHMVGCSNGGEIMLDLAIEQPDRVASLVMVDATPSGFEMGWSGNRRAIFMRCSARRRRVTSIRPANCKSAFGWMVYTVSRTRWTLICVLRR
ncbi:MAG: alpha/beta hydrolase [Anaerolineae bacterium]|nr:alpha/beta hydrolase [Anaerolineae bacterium]